MKINTANAFLVLKVINKMEMKKDIIDCLKNISTINENIKKNNLKLRDLVLKENENYYDLTDKEQDEINIKVLNANTYLAKRISELQQEQSELGMNLLFTFLEKLPAAEKEVYTTLAKIFNKKVVDIEKQDLDETIEMIKEIARSETVYKLFTLTAK